MENARSFDEHTLAIVVTRVYEEYNEAKYNESIYIVETYTGNSMEIRKGALNYQPDEAESLPPSAVATGVSVRTGSGTWIRKSDKDI